LKSVHWVQNMAEAKPSDKIATTNER